MEFNPIYNGSFQFEKCQLLKDKSLIGIDIGCSLTKIVCIHKDEEDELFDDNNSKVTFRYYIFHNDQLVSALTGVKQIAYLADNCFPICSTGVGGHRHKQVIESVFNRLVNFVTEDITIVVGVKQGFDRVGLTSLLSPEVEIKPIGKFEGEMIEKFKKVFENRYNKTIKVNPDNSLYPCLVYVCGSAAGYVYFNENGIGRPVGGLKQGGKSFIGLAKSVLETNKYEDIMKLAENGDRKNVDTEVKEILSNDPKSPYGRFPSDLSIFSFGKAVDYNKGLSDFSKEDLAASLVALRANEILHESIQMCMAYHTSKIYMIGNIFKSNLFEKEMKTASTVFPLKFELLFLDFGHFGALGALLS